MPESEYTFKHALTQEVTYRSLLVEQRRQLHERTAYVRARDLSEQLDEASRRVRAVNGLMAFYQTRAEHDRARELAEETLRLARGTRDPAQLLVAHWVMGASSSWRGEFPRAREHLEETIER